jgi:hypothetical protein
MATGDDNVTQQKESGRSESGQQKQTSQQSMNGAGSSGQGARRTPPDQQSRAGVGSSEGQDGGTGAGGSAPARPSAGTADIERSSVESQDSGRDGSMVNDSTGAFKERP